MNDLPFLECPSRTHFSDECYAAFGRALYVIQQFETKCRALAVLGTSIRTETAPTDGAIFTQIVDAMWQKKLRANIKLLKNYGLPTEIAGVLDKARVARNEIAHGSALGSEGQIETDSGRLNILNTLKDLIRSVAEADLLVSILIQLSNNEDLPATAYVIGYPDSVVKWVVEVFDER